MDILNKFDELLSNGSVTLSKYDEVMAVWGMARDFDYITYKNGFRVFFPSGKPVKDVH